jgi:hypothetical protein
LTATVLPSEQRGLERSRAGCILPYREGHATYLACLGRFFLPTGIGNVPGGIAPIAALNCRQVARELN